MTDKNKKSVLSMQVNNIVRNLKTGPRIVKCKRKLDLVSEGGKENIMPPVKHFRESISFLNSSVFDTSNGDKLIQYIRNKRGIRNVQPLFFFPPPENTKRCSFPIEIEAIQKTTKDSDENNKDIAKQQSPGKINEQATLLRKQGELRKISSRHSPRAAFVTLKRLSKNLGRHVLQKEFEKTQQDGQAFLPAAASTPLSKTPQCDEYESIVSNIGQSVDDRITNKSDLKQIESQCNKAETTEQSKTIVESLPSQTQKSQPQLIETDDESVDRNLIEKKGNSNTKEIENSLNVDKGLPLIEPVYNPITSTANRNLADNMEPMNISSSSSDSLLGNLDENIIEPLNGCSRKHGVIYDMSPKSGMKWVDSMMKNKVTGGINRKTRTAKKGNAVIHRNADPIPLKYTDMESALQQTLKNKTSKSNRRKLYSKGLSDNEVSFEDSPEKLHETSRHKDCTFNSVGNPSPTSKFSSHKNGKKYRHNEKFETITSMLSNWRATRTEINKSDQRSQTNTAITADEQHLFKVPQNPMLKLKKNVLKKSVAVGTNTNLYIINNDRSSSSSTESEEDSYSSHCAKSIYSNKSMQTSQTNYDKTVHHVNESVPINTTRLQSNSIQKDRRKLADSHANPKQSSTPIKSMNELPVDPDVTKENQNKSNRSHRSKNKLSSEFASESANEQNNAIDSTLNGRPSDRNIYTDTPGYTINQHSPIKKPTKNKISAANKRDNNAVIDLRENKQKNVEDESVMISKMELPNKKVKGENVKPRKTGRSKNKIDENIAQLHQTEITTSETGIRRSNRTHRPPRPYWTSCRQNDIPTFTYKESVIPTSTKRSRSRKMPIKKKKKEQEQQESRLQTIVEQTNNQIELSHLADDLFDALKESSMTQAQPDRIDKENRSKSSRPNKDLPTPSTSRCEQILPSGTDSGHATDSNNEQYPNDLLLNWLRNLIQPRTIASNPALVKIFSSNISIASSNNLVFHDVGGVGFAYYKKASQNDDNYGYMRFFPKAAKKMSKTKHFDLKFLCIMGVLDMSTEEETTILRNGDFVTVPKGVRYALTNKSDEVVLLFFIKS